MTQAIQEDGSPTTSGVKEGVNSLVSVMMGYRDGEKGSKYPLLGLKRATLSSPFIAKFLEPSSFGIARLAQDLLPAAGGSAAVGLGQIGRHQGTLAEVSQYPSLGLKRATMSSPFTA